MKGSSGAIAFGVNSGSSSRRAPWWKGGSDEIGGAIPTGAMSPGRDPVTMIEREEKCSVSYATSETNSWVSGSHAPP